MSPNHLVYLGGIKYGRNLLALCSYHLSSSVLLWKSFIVFQQDVVMEKWEKLMIIVSKMLLIAIFPSGTSCVSLHSCIL